MTLNATLIGAHERTAYTVEHRGNCVLIDGHVPASAFITLAKLAPRDAVLDTDAARMLGVTFAFGPKAELDKLKEQAAASQIAHTNQAHPHLSKNAIRWLATGQRGVSSETMFSVLTGHRLRDDFSVPWDPADFARCRLLLENVPELEPDLHKMAGVSPEWANLVRDWTKICVTMDWESPGWREGKGSAPATYQLIKKAVRP
jgi:hypothetical protein